MYKYMSVNAARKYLYTTQNRAVHAIRPCQSVFIRHTKKAAYNGVQVVSGRTVNLHHGHHGDGVGPTSSVIGELTLIVSTVSTVSRSSESTYFIIFK